ncbi:MAG: cytochrome-c peroxidase [Sphingobacteriales bacterium]|nr:cytochrome-c peroxidase [Sphingobacteriales bacterium]
MWNNQQQIAVFFIIWAILQTACEPDPTPTPDFVLEIPKGFPAPAVPTDNTLTKERITLGKQLFYDVALSRDSSVACASCHQLQYAFTDPVGVSSGAEGRKGFRNAPTLSNVAYQAHLLSEGGVPTLEMQVLVPFGDHNEFDFNIVAAGRRLSQNAQYRTQAQAAYGRDSVDAFVITRSIAAFERTLLSGNSPFDRFYFSGDSSALGAAAQRGWALFQSDSLACRQCHSGFNFTAGTFENNGLYEIYEDIGRARLTFLEEDKGKFKVPTLRNIAFSAPYMHDGSINSLTQVIEHYQSGGKHPDNQSPLIKGFRLNTQQQTDLLQFLQSLSDTTFIQNSSFLP